MTDLSILINGRAWGCKIKSNIDGQLILDQPKVKQGEDVKLKLLLNFDPEDVPKAVEVSLEEKQSHGYVLDSPQRQDISTPEVSIDLTLKYKDGAIGNYKVELNFRHAEFGTELTQVAPVSFQLSTPNVEITQCKSDPPKVSSGQSINLILGLDSPAPQKLRGIVFGRLTSNDKLHYKRYELEPKRISIIGDKEIVWPIEIPSDETGTGKLNAAIEFKSKDSITKKEFVGLIEIRNKRSLSVTELSSANEYLSHGDKLEFNAKLENDGLEKINFEIYPIISKVYTRTKEPTTESSKDRDSRIWRDDESEQWTLPSKTLSLDPDEESALSWVWEIPDDIANGKYQVKLIWKYLPTGQTGKFFKELFEIRSHHEIRIINAIVTAGSMSAGSNIDFQVLLSDSGTRAGEALEIDYQIFDILNQQVFQKLENINIESEESEFTFNWAVPENMDSGKYDLEVRISKAGSELTSKKFSKFFKIELPVKLELHSQLPKIMSADREIRGYLMEGESVSEKLKHNSLTIYKLNSNTHLFMQNNNVINYSIDRKSTAEELQEFGDELFDYLVINEYIKTEMTNKEFDHWLKLGHVWSSIILSSEGVLHTSSAASLVKKLKESQTQPPNFSSLDKLYRAMFKPIFKEHTGIKLEKIFHKSVLKNISIRNSDELKIISTIIKYLHGFPKHESSDLTSAKKQLKQKKQTKQKGSLDEKMFIKTLDELKKIIQTAVKFRKTVNSKLLQKKFSHSLMDGVGRLKKGRPKAIHNLDKYQIFRAGFGYILFYLAYDIVKTLRVSKRNNQLSSKKLIRLILFEILYNFVLMIYYNTDAKYNPYSSTSEFGTDINLAINQLRNASSKFWFYHRRWQLLCRNYLKNMSKRSELAFIHDHVKITTNPIILRGMRGASGNTKLILGNNGARAIALHPVLALPSIHWNLVEPEARVANNLYQLNRIVIKPKQTKEISISVAFPQTLSFENYAGILKLNPKQIRLITEIDKS